MPKSIQDLHTDLQLEVASHLTPEEIVKKISVLNKKYHQIANLQLLWKLKTKTHFPQVFRIHTKRKDVNWKALFIKHYKIAYPRTRQRDFSSVKAAKEGRLDILKNRGYDDETLMWAAHNKHQHLLDYFYRCWFDYENKTSWLSHAIKCNQPLETIEKIINQGANLKSLPNAIGLCTFPLHNAAKVGNIEIIKTLLDHGADINAVNLQQKSPLVLAIEQNHFEVVKFLLDRGATLKCHIQTYDFKNQTWIKIDFEFPLYEALLHANKAMVDFLLAKGASLADLLKQQGFFLSQTGQEIDPNILLHEVVKQNEIELAEFLLKHEIELAEFLKHVDINAHDAGNTPLMIACLEGHEEMVEMLLANGADFQIPGHDYLDPSSTSLDPISFYIQRAPVKLSPLFVAVKYGNQRIIQALVNKGADITEEAQLSANGSTLLHFAAQNGDLSLVQKLLENGAQIDAVDAQHNTPLNLSVSAGHHAVVEYLLAQGANCHIPNAQQHTPLHNAIMKSDKRLFKLLRQKNAGINFGPSTPVLNLYKSLFTDQSQLLYQAVLSGDLDMTTYVFKLRTNKETNHIGMARACMIAIEKNHLEIVKLFLTEKFSPVDEEKFLFQAIYHGNLNILKLLIQSGLPFKSIFETRFYTTKDRDVHNGVLPIHVAAMNGHLAMVQFLITQGANVNAKNNPEDGMTALVFAAKYGHKNVFDFLAQCNAHIFSSTLNALSPKSEFAQLKTAFYHAMANNHQEILDSILAIDKTLINQTFAHRIGLFTTPLYFAVEQNDKALVEYCLAHGARMDDHLLHYAVDKGNNEIVKLLLKNIHPSKRQAKLNLSLSYSYIKSNGIFLLSDAGYKPLHTAIARFHVDIVKTLLGNSVPVDQLTDQCQSTALLLAVQRSNTFRPDPSDLDLVKLLISCGANVNAANARGETPLSAAIRKYNLDFVKLLIENGATFTLDCYQAINETRDLNTPLKTTFFPYLLSQIQIDKPLANGNTLLHFAAADQDFQFINILLEMGANVNALNNDGKKPSDLIPNGFVLSRLKLAEYKKKLNDKAFAQQQMVSQEQDLTASLPSKTKGFSLFGIKIKKEEHKPKVSLQSKILAVSALEQVYFQNQPNNLSSYSDIFKKSKGCKKLKKEIEKEIAKQEKQRVKNYW